MSKKILLLPALLLLLPFSSLAKKANDFYIGLEGGYDITDFYKTLKIDSGDTNIYNKKDDLTGTGNFINGVIGYQWNFDKVFLDTEFSGGLSNLKYEAYYADDTHREASRGKFTLDNNLELSVLPGYFFNHHIGMYGKVGVARGDFTYAEYKDSGAQHNFGLTEHKDLDGFIYGAGALFPLNKNLKLRLEYNRILYQTYTNNTFPVPFGQTRTIKLTPTSNQFVIGIVYTFS